MTCAIIVGELEQRTGGKVPYTWQLEVSEALLLGLDCSVIAGTGTGKTMPFVLPLLAQPNKHVLIISPLDALEADQAEKFRDINLMAVAVNGNLYNQHLHQVWSLTAAGNIASAGRTHTVAAQPLIKWLLLCKHWENTHIGMLTLSCEITHGKH